MALTVHVGLLATALADGDHAAAEQLRGEFAIINSVLSQAGLPTHDEPETTADPRPRAWAMLGYDGLHYLRRVAAHLDLRGVLPPPGDESASEDPVLDAYVSATLGEEPGSPEAARILAEAPDAVPTFDHLIVHSDSAGYYLPVPLDHPVIVESADEDEDEDGDENEAGPAGHADARGRDDEDDDAYDDEELIPGGNIIGSSLGLRDELRRLRDALGVPADVGPDDDRLAAAAEAQGEGQGWSRYGVESLTCLRLLAACDASVALGSALIFA